MTAWGGDVDCCLFVGERLGSVEDLVPVFYTAQDYVVESKCGECRFVTGNEGREEFCCGVTAVLCGSYSVYQILETWECQALSKEVVCFICHKLCVVVYLKGVKIDQKRQVRKAGYFSFLSGSVTFFEWNDDLVSKEGAFGMFDS